MGSFSPNRKCNELINLFDAQAKDSLNHIELQSCEVFRYSV